ncbi:oligosaccharide flippase family protein [Fuscovulum ytuae]|uniref:Oligosaccharide flippase family protein n=1 Tax=Fuscovulum ytuae TaxID=3042299 RepID=A0ABY8Q6V0_9RHOB|nr:oligosaccharide flippase family protein [Fuscovulum sp. YMD61]WGV15932.1 oligosaccharide flippase family protein [Fuscovulum sp. YMD61]
MGSNLLLTRLLAPEAFGLIGLAMTVVVALSLLSDIGINRSIIREPDGDTPAFLQAAWRVKVLRGLIIAMGVCVAAILLWLLGPHFAAPESVYADPLLPGLIATTAFVALSSGLLSCNSDLANRRMDYRRIVTVKLSGQLISILATLGAAYLNGSVWAIAIGIIIGAIADVLLSFLCYPGPPMRWNADPQIAARLWKFGRWIMLSSALSIFHTNAEKFILAALLTPTEFGLYIIAVTWLGFGMMLFSTLQGRIGYNAFSEISLSRRHDLPRVYRKLQWLADLYLISVFATLHFGASPLIDLLYTDTYSEAASFLSLTAFGVLSARYNLATELLMSLGDSRALGIASSIRSVALVIALPLGYWTGGVVGLILAYALYPLVQAPFLLFRLHGHLPRSVNLMDLAWPGLVLVLAVELVGF